MVERIVPGEPSWTEFSAAHLARYLLAADYARGRRVLDAGAGSGYGAQILRSAGAAAVVGIDIDRETVRRAEERFGGDGIEFFVDDCEQLEHVIGPFDLICSFENIEHLHRPEKFLEAAVRLLCPDGLLLISTPDRTSTPPFVNGRPNNRFHTIEWYRDEFYDLLRKYFVEVDMRAQVETTALRSRIEAVGALQRALIWSNPIAALILRWWPARSWHERPWRKLAHLAAPSIGDYPIVSLDQAELFGAPAFHVAICREPRAGGR